MKRRFFAVLLAVCMCLGLTTTAFASEGDNGATAGYSEITPRGGTEIWSSDRDIVGSFTLVGNNRTPVKTMGKTGLLYITLKFNAGNVSKKVRVRIENADTLAVLADWTTPAAYSFDGLVSSNGLRVTNGQRIMVEFTLYNSDGSADPNGSLYLTYGYAFNFFGS